MLECKLHCEILFIGIGAGLAGPVLSGPLFRRFNEIYYRYLCARRYRQHGIHARLLQADHFKSPSYAPVIAAKHFRYGLSFYV